MSGNKKKGNKRSPNPFRIVANLFTGTRTNDRGNVEGATGGVEQMNLQQEENGEETLVERLLRENQELKLRAEEERREKEAANQRAEEERERAEEERREKEAANQRAEEERERAEALSNKRNSIEAELEETKVRLVDTEVRLVDTEVRLNVRMDGTALVKDVLNNPLIINGFNSAKKQKTETSTKTGSGSLSHFDLRTAGVQVKEISDSAFYMFLTTRLDKLMVNTTFVWDSLLQTLLDQPIAEKFNGFPLKLSADDSEDTVVNDVTVGVYVPLADALRKVPIKPDKFQLKLRGPDLASQAETFFGSKKFDRLACLNIVSPGKEEKTFSKHILEFKRDRPLPYFDFRDTQETTRPRRKSTPNQSNYLTNLAEWHNNIIEIDKNGNQDPTNVVRQTFHYMCFTGIKYAIITSYERWSFLIWDETEKCLWIAGQYHGRTIGQFNVGDRDISLWEILFLWILCTRDNDTFEPLKQVPGFKEWVNKQDDANTKSKKNRKNQSASAAGDEDQDESFGGGDGNGATDDDGWNDGVTKANEHRPFWFGFISVLVLRPVDFKKGRQPGIDAELLGSWRTGFVWRKVIDGKDMVIKQCCWQDGEDEEEQLSLRNLIKTELFAYDRLHSLQGRIIPKLYYAGNMMVHWTDCVVTSYEGISVDVDSQIDETFIAKALAGLDEIHELGVLHGDAAMRNLLIREDGNPIWIDFGYATFNPTKEETMKERDNVSKELHMLLKNDVEEDLSKGDLVSRKRLKIEDVIS